jgi:3-hydroxyisobutyrate dehydrogenase
VPVELAPLVLEIFKDGARRYGPREWSSNIIKRFEEACAIQVLGEGFPAQMVDEEPEAPGYEVLPRARPAASRI